MESAHQRLTCPSCATALRASDIDFDLKVARCVSCDAVFSYASLASPRPATPKDASVRERQEGEALVLEYAWFGLTAVMLLVFSVFWDGFLFVWYSLAVAEGDIVMLTFPILHVVAGVVITYVAAASLLNRTTVRIDRSQGISVRHGPLPWRGNLDLPRDSISQLFLESRIIRQNKRMRTVWDLVALDARGQRTPVVRSIDDKQRARFLEHRAEQFLGIEDRPVAGEDASA